MKLLLSLLLLASFEVSASNCQNDVKKFCAGVKSGQGLILKCLHDNLENVSRACAKELRQQVSEEDNKNPCHKDLVDFCGDMPLAGEKLGYCLLKHERKLGHKCADDFKSKKAQIMGSNECANEVVEFCYEEVKGSKSKLTRCLIKNRSKASPLCAKSLEKVLTTMKAKNSCFDDIEKHCAAYDKPSDIQSCLEKKKSSLTPKCQTAVDKQTQKIKSDPCYQDLNSICKTAQTFQNKMKCLNMNMSKLTPACRNKRSERAGKIKKMVEACEADRLKFCAREPRMMGKITKCLKRQKEKLSPQCKAVL